MTTKWEEGLYTTDLEIIETNKPYISDYEVNILAKMILPQIQAFYESEEGKRKFEEWKLKQEKKWYFSCCYIIQIS